jgi:iron complex outermembrane receptor protein
MSLAALAAALAATPAVAQDADDAQPKGNAAAAHPDPDQQTIVITGVRRPLGDVLGGTAVLDQEQLMHDAKPSLGDTLASLPGVSSSSFGPSSSRPILRGLSGEDAPILIDGDVYVPTEFLNRAGEMRVRWNRASQRLELQSYRP